MLVLKYILYAAFEIVEYIMRIRAKLFTSLKADLSQDINISFAFSRCLKGPFINHVDHFLDFFDPHPPPMWTDVDFWQTSLLNHVDF